LEAVNRRRSLTPAARAPPHAAGAHPRDVVGVGSGRGAVDHVL